MREKIRKRMAGSILMYGGGIHTFNFLFHTLIDIPIYIWLGIPLRRYPECSKLC